MGSHDIDQFIDYMSPDDVGLLEELRTYAEHNSVPIIRKEMRHFLEFLVVAYRPKNILEIGTAIGYSSLVMAEGLNKLKNHEFNITTIERSDEMAEQANKNFSRSPYNKNICFKHGEAEDVLKILTAEQKQYDMIFMDAAKGQYLTFLPYCMTMLKTGGILVSDNVLQDGDVARSRFNVVRRKRTIHQRMRDYLWEINHRDDLKTSLLNVADGATLSVKL